MPYFAVIIFLVIAFPVLLLFRAKIKLVISEAMRVEITFAIVTVELSDFKGGSSKSKKSFSLYRRIIKRIISIIEKSEVTLHELRLSRGAGLDFSPSSYTAPYRYHIAISALLAYIRGKAQKLIIEDNAVILIPDEDEHFSLILTLRTRLFYVLRNILGILYETRENKKREKKYVGN